jgi:hypothetical protein
MNILLYSLLLTILIEFFILFIFLRENPVRILLYTILINCLTLPLATTGYHYVISNLILIEIMVIITETLFFRFLFKIRYTKAFTVSLAANLVSAVMGLLIF